MNEMNYFNMICERNPQKEALVADGISYSYGELVSGAKALGRGWSGAKAGTVRVIKEKEIVIQLLSFLACYVTGEIPLIVPFDCKGFENGEHLTEMSVPDNACMAVATSGTTGEPKIYFRSYKSWAGYFDVQNKIFQVTEESRLFAQGSLAFTGNLNLYMAQFYAGGTVIAENAFLPKQWERRIREERVNSIYLIPSKLLLIPQLFQRANPEIRMILSGSQSLGREDASLLKNIFPNTKILLYYGASELNYITYVTDGDMTDDRNLIGKPFPEVGVTVRNGEIFVDTAYHVEGVKCPYSLSDGGYQDESGNFYFLGRKDDIMNVRGRKISALRIENALEGLPEICEAAVVSEEREAQRGEQITAYVVPSKAWYGEEEIYWKLRGILEHFEMPRKIYPVTALPRNESGKVDKKRLSVLQ